jgi:uncharacterized protein involved in outer membrane biogenesis
VLTVSADQVDVDELLALAAAFAAAADEGGPAPAKSERSGAARSDARIAATITADTARTGELEIQNFATELTADGDRVTLSPLTFELFGGRYEGALNASLGDAIAATLESRVTGLDVARLAAFGGAPDTITGRCQARARSRAGARTCRPRSPTRAAPDAPRLTTAPSAT